MSAQSVNETLPACQGALHTQHRTARVHIENIGARERERASERTGEHKRKSETQRKKKVFLIFFFVLSRTRTTASEKLWQYWDDDDVVSREKERA